MRAPIDTVFGNVVYRDGLRDPWAVFRLTPTSHGGLSRSEQEELLGRIAALCASAESDLQLLRVTEAFDAERYAAAALAAVNGAGHAEPWRVLIDHHRRALERQAPFAVAVFLCVRLAPPNLDLTAHVSRALDHEPRRWLETLRESLALSRTRSIRAEVLSRHRQDADRAHQRVLDFVDARPARLQEVQWLVRRAFCRGLGEPEIEQLHAPQALAVEAGEGALVAPLEGDVLRWTNSRIERGARSLRIESELGTSEQTLLCVGALPPRAAFPGRQAELLFAPLEDLPCAIDACASIRYVPNDQAIRLVQRRVVDAAQIIKEEQFGDHGPQDTSLDRHDLGRSLLATLREGSQPPLLRTTITLAVGAPEPEERIERVQALKRAYGDVKLHTPIGEQLEAFCQMLPGQPAWLSGYEDYLLPSQLGAMLPTATRAVGSPSGVYLGHVRGRALRPVLHDLYEGSRSNRPVSVLNLGTLGAGKTALTQLLLYHGFCQGARIVDIDPKCDHRFHLLPEVAPHSEVIELRPAPKFRGLLDPLRISPPDQRHETTVAFLTDVLPQPVPQEWKTAIVKAVRRAAESHDPCCLEVVRLLRADGGRTARTVADALEVYADAGLSQLGFARGRAGAGTTQRERASGGHAQVTYVPIRSLPVPEPGVARAELSEDERVGRTIVRLLALYAMKLMSTERERLKLLAFDEAWMLMGDAHGRRLIEQLNRWGRSELAVPILSTHLVADVEQMDNLLGPRFVFRMSSESEAAQALALLGLEPDERQVIRALMELPSGHCYHRDLSGRVEPIVIDFVDQQLLARLSTTPAKAAA